jgi:RNA polymerase sigma factor (sigma-70 family)
MTRVMSSNPTEDESGARLLSSRRRTGAYCWRRGGTASPDSREAMERLCRTYWPPLYAFVRRSRQSPADAGDLVQGFFAYVLEKHVVDKARQEVGRFRSFLLATFRHYVSQEHKREHARKRGGDRIVISFDGSSAEQWLVAELASELSPDVLYERHWAATVVNEALEMLRQEYETDGKRQLFDAIHPYLQGERGQRSYAELGAALGLSESAVKSSVFRLRRRSRELLRAVVRARVESVAGSRSAGPRGGIQPQQREDRHRRRAGHGQALKCSHRS